MTDDTLPDCAFQYCDQYVPSDTERKYCSDTCQHKAQMDSEFAFETDTPDDVDAHLRALYVDGGLTKREVFREFNRTRKDVHLTGEEVSARLDAMGIVYQSGGVVVAGPESRHGERPEDRFVEDYEWFIDRSGSSSHQHAPTEMGPDGPVEPFCRNGERSDDKDYRKKQAHAMVFKEPCEDCFGATPSRQTDGTADAEDDPERAADTTADGGDDTPVRTDGAGTKPATDTTDLSTATPDTATVGTTLEDFIRFEHPQPLRFPDGLGEWFTGTVGGHWNCCCGALVPTERRADHLMTCPAAGGH